MTSSSSSTFASGRYSTVAMALHWLIAAIIVVQIGMGWYMGTLGRAPLHRTMEGWHISLGLTVLLLTLVRIGWGLTHPHPPLPAGMPSLDRRLAGLIHPLFYVLLLALPLSGWVMESFGTRPIPFWGLAWPHFPALSALTAGQDPRALKKTIEEIHGTPLVWTMVALVALHVLGALKHQFDGHPVLWRMAGWMKRP
jgi:cytochrome b561